MTLDNWRYLKSKWLNLVDIMIAELYTIDKHQYTWFNIRIKGLQGH